MLFLRGIQLKFYHYDFTSLHFIHFPSNLAIALLLTRSGSYFSCAVVCSQIHLNKEWTKNGISHVKWISPNSTWMY